MRKLIKPSNWLHAALLSEDLTLADATKRLEYTDYSVKLSLKLLDQEAVTDIAYELAELVGINRQLLSDYCKRYQAQSGVLGGAPLDATTVREEA